MICPYAADDTLCASATFDGPYTDAVIVSTTIRPSPTS